MRLAKPAFWFAALASLSGCVAAVIEVPTAPTRYTEYRELPTRQTIEIGPEMVPCQGAFPQQCMIVDGEYFYDTIDGFTHVSGKTTVAEIERIQRCDPSAPNSCPQDVGIYSYRLVRVISER